MCLELQPVQQEDLSQSKADRQEAFQLGAQEGGFSTHGRQILPEGDIDHSLCAQGSIAYKAVLDGEMAGGAILSLDVEKHYGYLDFLYVRHDVLEKGIGKFMWFEIERLHPDVRVWGYVRPTLKSEACIFYVNVCHFHVVDYWNARHKDPHSSFEEPEDEEDSDFGMISSRKEIGQIQKGKG